MRDSYMELEEEAIDLDFREESYGLDVDDDKDKALS